MSAKASEMSNIEGYNAWSSFYDQYPNPTIAVDELHFPSFWSRLSKARVLEIGCGTGRHTLKLANQGNDVVGIDQSSGMLAEARRKVKNDSATFIEADFLTYEKFSKQSFDAIIVSLVIEHIKDINFFFKKTASLLKTDGKIFISEIHPERTAQGTFAHFKDPGSGEEIKLECFAHKESDILSEASSAGLVLVKSCDVVGDVSLRKINSKWSKYINIPMIKIFTFKSSHTRQR